MARQMRSLDSYLEEAKGMILKWGSLWMLKDDQILGQVASAIMRAENDHNPEHDSGATVVTLRVTYGRREIWNVYRKQNSINKRGRHFSIDTQHDTGASKPFSFAETIEDKSDSFLEIIQEEQELEDKKKKVRELLSDSYLTDRQREFLEAKYIEGLTSKEISERFNVSKQAVSDCMGRALHKLKEITQCY